MSFWATVGLWLGIAGAIFAIWEGSRKAVRWFRRKLRATDYLTTLGELAPSDYDPDLPCKQSRLAMHYLQRIQEQNTFVSFPGVVRNLPLEKLLITPRLGAGPEVLLGQAAPPVQRNSSEAADLDLDEQLEEGAVLPWPQLRELAGTFLVMGPAGTGKSTLLRHEAFLCAEAVARAGAQWDNPQIPVPVIVRAYELVAGFRTGKSLRQAIQEKILAVLQLDQALDAGSRAILEKCVDEAWDAHSIRLLLDALDELASEDDRNLALRLLQSHLETGGCPFILTTRPLRTGLPALHQTVRTLYLAPFDVAREMPRFIDNWFQDLPEKSDVRDGLKALVGRNRRLAGVCRTPLLLAFLCLAAEHDGTETLSTRVELYQCLLKGLLETWPNQLKPQRKFNEAKIPVLRHIGWLQLSDPQSLAGSELIQELIRWSEKTYRWSYNDIEALLAELTAVDCVLRAQESFPSRDYCFFHPTVAEYFAALEASMDSAAKEQIAAAIKETRWHGAFAMFVAMSTDPLPQIRRVASVTARDSLAQARLVEQCASECGDKLDPEAMAECVWIAQSLTPLPWTTITARESLCAGLEQLAADADSRKILSLINEILDGNLTLPKLNRKKSAASPLRHGTPEALAALNSPHLLTRWAALWVLAAAGGACCAPQAADLLCDPHPAIRGMAAWLLGLLGHKPASGAIRKLLQDQDWMVRQSAASALGHLGDDPALDELLALAQHDRDEIRHAAVWALANLATAEHLPQDKLLALKDFFLQLLHSSSDGALIATACSGVGKLAAIFSDLHACLPAMLALLDHADPGVGGSAAYAISMLADERNLPLLQTMAASPDGRFRTFAANALGRLKHADSAGLLVRLLTDRDSRVQRGVRWALYQLPHQEAVEEEIVHAIQTADEPTAAMYLSHLFSHQADTSSSAPSAQGLPFAQRPAIQSAMQDRAIAILDAPQARLRAIACFVLQYLPCPKAIEPCLKHLDDSDPGVRAAVLVVLQRQPDARAIEPCLKLLDDPSPGVRTAACGFFHVQPDPRAIEPCLGMLGDSDERVRASALVVLQRQPDARVVESCLKLLDDPDPGVRASALIIFQRRPDARAIVPGLKLLQDTAPGVRAAACGLAARLTLPAALRDPVLRTLRKLLNDPDERVRRSAQFAIQAVVDRQNRRRKP